MSRSIPSFWHTEGIAVSRNSSSRVEAFSSVWPATETSQYSDRSRHSSRYLAAEIACDASRPGTTSAEGMSRWSKSSCQAPGANPISLPADDKLKLLHQNP